MSRGGLRQVERKQPEEKQREVLEKDNEVINHQLFYKNIMG